MNNRLQRMSEGGIHGQNNISVSELLPFHTFLQREMSEGMKRVLKLAERGNAVPGRCIYAACEGVREDMTETIKWFRKAAEQGLERAQFVLGVCWYERRWRKQGQGGSPQVVP